MTRRLHGTSAWTWSLLVACVMAIPLLMMFTASCQAQEPFTLREHLGRDWRNESVSFPLNTAQLREAQAGRALAGADGQPVAYQLVPGANGASTIEFLVDLPPYATRTYAFGKTKAAMKTDLAITETADAIQLVNGVTGIAIRTKLAAGQGPIDRIRLQSGKWVGDSRLVSDLPLTGYTAAVTARGPVFTEVVCKATLGGASTWETRFRLYAGEPVVLVDEQSAVAGNGSSFQLDLQRDFAANQIFHRRSYQDGFVFKLLPLQTGNVFTLEPWQNWYASQLQGADFSLCTVEQAGDKTVIQPDMLSVGARDASVWRNPDQPKDQPQAPPRGMLIKDDGGLHLDFALKYGQRKWMISALNADLALRKDGDRYPVCPLPHQYVIKYGQFPLNRVKDYVLAWDSSKAQYPHLASMVNKITDERTARKVIADAEESVQGAVDNFLLQPVPYGSAPHMTQIVGRAMTQADNALGTGLMTPEQRERMLAKAAFVAYAINRPDYWSPARGYAGNPNMTTTVFGYLNSAACLVNTHPEAANWSKIAVHDLLDTQLHGWSDDNGGWLEAPHYAMVSYDAILGALLMTNNAGFNTTLYTDSKVKSVINWFSKIATPPDGRINNIRHQPCIGNTYIYEPTGEFGILANLFRDKDPEFSAQMQWMYKQQGSFGAPGIGGAYPALDGQRAQLVDLNLPAKAPAWKSEWFPQTGVMLRNGFPDPRETQLYLIAGNHRDHYDHDSGSFTLWGKGRIVADDFGYYGNAPLVDHNSVDSPVNGGVMQVKQFATSDAFDCVDGTSGGWRRQIAFIKDADLLGPNYFVLCDSFNTPTAATWRLWLTAAQVNVQGQSVVAVGKEDVDTDLFFTQPGALELRTEEKSKTAGSGLRPDMSWGGGFTTTQLGLIAGVKDCQAISTVIYPRLKTEKAPVFTAIADGKGVKVQHAAGTDYVFVSPTPVTFTDGGITFNGTVGAVMLRGNHTTLALGAAGAIAANGHTLTDDKARTQTW